MFERRRVGLVGDQGDVEERRWKQLPVENARLVQMQPARAGEDDGLALFDGDGAVALAIEIGQRSAQRRENVLTATHDVGPGVGGGVFQVQHHAGRSRVQHLDHQLGVVSRAGHLVALVTAPLGQLNAPVAARGLRRLKVCGQATLVGFLQHANAPLHQRLLARGECAVQRQQELEESRRQVGGRLDGGGGGIDPPINCLHRCSHHFSLCLPPSGEQRHARYTLCWIRAPHEIGGGRGAPCRPTLVQHAEQ